VVALAHTILGWCSLAPSRDADPSERTGEITALYVDPDHWRCGHGRRLMLAALDEAQVREWSEVIVWVLASNSAAFQFYAAMGFALDGAEKLVVTPVPMKETRLRIALDAG
jgi:GNAT superfamily N-acetyltransferase